MATTIAELIATKKQQLTDLQARIAKAEEQQAYALDDGQGKQNVTRGNLESMYQREKDLESDILELENGSSSSFYARLP